MGEDKGFHLAETIMGMSASAWARHTNPWSGWSRVSILPLLAIAAWSRDWIGWWALGPIAVVLVWTWLNPRLFPPPASTDNWMSQGVLGEQVWLTHGRHPAVARHRTAVRSLSGAGLIGALLLLAGLVLLDLPLTIAGLTIAILSKLWLLDRMVRLYRETAGSVRPASLPSDPRKPA